MVYQVECRKLVNESRGVSLTYYLSGILNELYRYRNSRPLTLKISNNDIEKFDYIYQHLISNPGRQRDKLLNSKKIYIINFLLSEYQYCFSERIQFRDIKDYLKLIIDANYKYKKGLAIIHQGVKVISKIYHKTKEDYTNIIFENVKVPPLCYKAKQEITLSNILCAFQCMELKPLTLNHNVVKNTLMTNSSIDNSIFEMYIPNGSIIDDKISVISEEDNIDLVSLIDEGEDYYHYSEEEEYKEEITVSNDESGLLEEETIEVEEYDFEEYSDVD